MFSDFESKRLYLTCLVVLGGWMPKLKQILKFVVQFNMIIGRVRILLTGLFICLFSHVVHAAQWINDSQVVEIAVKYGNGCVTLEGGEVIRLDLSSDHGKAEYSLALAAHAAGKELDVYQNDDPMVGGCNTGTTIKPHSMLRMSD